MSEPTPKAFRRTRVAIRGLKLKWPTCIALNRDHLAVIEGRDLLTVFNDVSAEQMLPDHVQSVGWHPGAIAFSPSHKYVQLHSEQGSYVEIWDVARRKPFAAVSGPERVALTIVTVDDRELLICSRRPGMLESYFLPDKETGFSLKWGGGEAFIVDALVPLDDGDTVAMVGHRFLEGADRVVRFSLKQLLAGAKLEDEALDRPLTSGLAMAVGPGVNGQLVAFKDPPSRGASGTLSVLDAASGALLETLEYAPPVEPGSQLMATESAIAVAARTRVDFLPRKALHSEKLEVVVRSVAFDPADGVAALMTEDGFLELVQLPSAAT